MFKFDMIVDDSFCRLNEPMIVHESVSVNGFFENGLKARSNPKMATGKEQSHNSDDSDAESGK